MIHLKPGAGRWCDSDIPEMFPGFAIMPHASTMRTVLYMPTYVPFINCRTHIRMPGRRFLGLTQSEPLEKQVRASPDLGSKQTKRDLESHGQRRIRVRSAKLKGDHINHLTVSVLYTHHHLHEQSNDTSPTLLQPSQLSACLYSAAAAV